MLIKCICTNCSGHLEFDEENVGTQIKCPHCGWDTTLYDAGVSEPELEATGVLSRLRKHARALVYVGGGVLGLALVVVAGCWWGVPLVKQFFSFSEGTLIPGLILVVVVWVFVAAVLWTALPIALIFQLGRLTAVLKQIEAQQRPARGARVEVKAEDEAEPAGPAESGTT